MLHLALAALLAGSLITGGLDGDKDKDKDKAKGNQPIESILVPQDDATDAVFADDPINDTYALGRTEDTRFKAWLGYGYGEVTDAYLPDGEQFNESQSPGGNGEFGTVTSQRAFLGAQINALNFTNFSVGVGGQLTAAKDEFDNVFSGITVSSSGVMVRRANAQSDFTLQNAKVYGIIRGRTLGVHGGYIFDLGNEDIELFDEQGQASTEAPVSDNVDAWFVGVDFDYPSERFRLFAGIDYFNRDELANRVTSGNLEDDEIVVWNAGVGLKFSFVEIGAAALLRTNLAINRLNQPTGGGHQGSIAPYLRLSPPSFPVSLSVKGAVLGEYADYGFSIGGANDIVTNTGVTATITYGF